MLTGCATSTPPQLAAPPIPASLMQPCPPLVPLTGTTGADVARTMVNWGKAYNACADGKSALVNALKQGGV
jgi:hypothetical protein